MRATRFLCAAALALPLLPAQAPQPVAESRGVAVTFESQDNEQRQKEGSVTVRARLVALHVERGETPTPLLSPGMFTARYEGTVRVPVRDSYSFRLVGKGDAELHVNGSKVLAGALRPGRPLDSEPVRLKKGANQISLRFDGTPLGDGTVRLLWSGPEFAFEPIGPEQWHCTDDAAMQQGELRRTGQQLLVERRCALCHMPIQPVAESALGELDNAGPDLRAAAERMHPGWMARWLADPHAVRPEASMPKLRLSASEVADVASYLGTLGTPLPEPTFTIQQAEHGSEKFLELGCIACHVPPGDDVALGGLGDRIHLGFVQPKWHGSALIAYLLAPRTIAPHTRMPDFKLSLQEATELTAYLLDGRDKPDDAPTGSADRGKRLVARAGCVRCHPLDVTDSSNFTALQNLPGKKGCLVAADGAPDFDLDEGEAAALRSFLPVADVAPFRRAPADYAARAISSHRCTNCHGRDGVPSAWSRVVVEQVALNHPVTPAIDPVGQGVPALTWVGEKLQPSWLVKFVTGQQPSPRPWLHARMPAFAADGEAIVAGLLREHGYTPQDDPRVEPDPNQVAVGQRLVKMGEGFGCVQCHAIGEQKAAQVLEREGIDFKLAAVRLRHDYYSRWLLDPIRIDSESKMTRFADRKGKTAFADVYGGDARRQFEAIWNFIQSLR